MKITDFQIDSFGVWKGLTVDKLSDNMTLFCGYNEAGKTTMMPVSYTHLTLPTKA